MPIRWRVGGEMATVDLREFGDDQIVIHFGGSVTSVDAYTFANSFVAFADTVRAVNSVINPAQGVEVRLEAIGPGSFRAVVRRMAKGIGGFFSDGSRRVFWGLIAALIFDRLIRNDPTARITVNTREVVIVVGKDRVIIPRTVYDQMQNVRDDPEVQRNLSRTFDAIERDDAVENFGLTPRMADPEPVVQIPRAIFPQLSSTPAIAEGDPKRRERRERARLVILKAWLTPGNRKWSFEWNGVPISAPIKDESFWGKLASREYLIGQGDALDAELRFKQFYDEELESDSKLILIGRAVG